eukprot:CAMPEP_0117806394 /NCGR_PEP_ID=MMETSP0948-20121206/18538_1 /TAXON_ID=44440 /ORGANISM="Chattonella subsalsa, Strain CCMP2191" /LENGTH=105 /DNA_ID=CAMNT_0005640853 /DNA_START=75 /DNA_END=392 /DNA_ORIENTATION=+
MALLRSISDLMSKSFRNQPSSVLFARSFAVGRVKWFDKKKGFGFILAENQDELFVHHSSLNMEGFRFLKENQEVSYDEDVAADGKIRAINVCQPNGEPLENQEEY